MLGRGSCFLDLFDFYFSGFFDHQRAYSWHLRQLTYLAGAVCEFREDRVTRAEEFLLAPVQE